MFLTLYVNDILLGGNNIKMIQTTKQWLSSVFEMKDMGEVRYVIGVKITRNHSKKLRGLRQEVYINKILERFRVPYSEPVDTPVREGLTLSLNRCLKADKEKEIMSNVLYTSVVGNLMYVMLCTRSDICIAVGLAATQGMLIGKPSIEFFSMYVVQVIMSFATKVETLS